MIAKWQEPAPAKQTRVLPVPDMEPKKRRGGRRCASHCASLCGPCGLVQVDKAAHTCLWGEGVREGHRGHVLSSCSTVPHIVEAGCEAQVQWALHLGAGRCA